ncbi:hypothetical protein NM688_g3424 [Phlebia brevispora]|uniref:Uncharacterized protein n=1 Tax=Phlebia brevispora TaxID=194682 RepID=A0ACC1T6G1_9APHY|nr:hypothetical protein NM688_g3424 [Phlebia brevispora]
MGLTIEEASLIGLFMETLGYGITLVSSGYCLRLLLCQTGRIVLKPTHEIRWWAVNVVIVMTTIHTLDLAVNLRQNLRAFVWANGLGPNIAAAIFNDKAGWPNIMRTILYVLQAAIADSILIYRVYVVVYSRRLLMPFVFMASMLIMGTVAGILVTALGLARETINTAVTETITIVVLALDVLFNAVAISLIVRKLWKTRTTSPDADKWLLLIRIIVESGLLYMLAVLLLAISVSIENLVYCVEDVVGSIITIASILLMIRTHNVFQTRLRPSEPTGAVLSTAIFVPRSYIGSTTIPLSTDLGSGPEAQINLAVSESTQSDEKAPDEASPPAETLDA